MQKNPFLKMEEKVTKKLYGNTGTITYCVFQQTYDASTGRISETKVDVVCDISYSNPRLISDYVVDRSTEIVGEITLKVPYKNLQDNLKATVGSTGIELSYFRQQPFGVSLENDYLTILGKDYRIVKMLPENVYANVPASVTFQLKGK